MKEKVGIVAGFILKVRVVWDYDCIGLGFRDMVIVRSSY